MDDALSIALLGCGCPHRFRRVAPSRRLLEASLSVCPWQTPERHADPMTHHDDPHYAVAAARPPDPGRLGRCRRRPGHVRQRCTRPPQPGPEAFVPVPWTRRTPPGMACLSPGGLWTHVLLWHAPRLGCASPHLPPTYGTTPSAAPDAGRSTPAPVQPCDQPQAPGRAHAHLCRWPARRGRRAPAAHCSRT